MPELWGRSEEEQVRTIRASTAEIFSRLGIDIEGSDAIIEEVARNILSTGSPAPDEGIQDLGRG